MTQASTDQATPALLAMRAALASGPLLGFDTSGWAGDGALRAKQAFVGTANIRTVTSAADSGAGTLREVLQSQVDGLLINFDPSLAGQTIQLQGNLTINQGITIDGRIGDGSITLSGTANEQAQIGGGIFTIAADGNDQVSLNNINFINGNSQGVSGNRSTVPVPGGNAGGAIYAQSGNLALRDSTFTNNSAIGAQGSPAFDGGGPAPAKAAGTGGNAAGAVYVEPGVAVTASNLIFSNNLAMGGAGGDASQTYPMGMAGTADPNSNNQTVQAAAVCYASGTRILTASGEFAVEDLAVGDIAVTASGAHRPIRWIGHRTLDCRNQPEPHHVHPVRIQAHAFGENRPARDLIVSPGHAIAVDILGEVLIPAIALINGSTITQEDVDSITYWHVELDSHDILIAEGQPAESYLDMGNRGFFAGGDVVDLGARPDADATTRTTADFCRPFHAEGPLVDVARGQLRHRAVTLGWRIVQGEAWAGVHLEVDGRIVQPKIRGLAACFELPAGAVDIVLVSPTSVPMHISDLRDRRDLGLPLKSVHLDDGLGQATDVALDDPRLSDGFHVMAHDHRWTADRARLPSELLAGLEGTVFLRVELSGAPLPQLIAPVAVAPDQLAEPAEALAA